MRFSRVCVVGLGHIGLPTALILAGTDLETIGVDVDEQLLDSLRNETIRIREPGLQPLLESVLRNGHFQQRPTPEPADAFIICVPTPLTAERCADLTAVDAAVQSVLPFLRPGNLLIIESTVPPGTTETRLARLVQNAGLDPVNDIFMAHCPERVLPGNLLHELVHNGRCIGGLTPEAAEHAKALFVRFVKGPIVLTDARTAEMSKLMENTFRDVNIALANEFARICANLLVNVRDAISIANQHSRVDILQPGPGVGGHCIAVDPYFLVEQCPAEARLIAAAREVNESMPDYVVAQVTQLVGKAPARVAVLGLAYKPETEDIRQSPAVAVVERLRDAGYEVSSYDPWVNTPFAGRVDSLFGCITGAQILVLLTDHTEFQEVDPEAIRRLMASPIVLDTRSCWASQRWEEAGICYRAVGDGHRTVSPPAVVPEI